MYQEQIKGGQLDGQIISVDVIDLKQTHQKCLRCSKYVLDVDFDPLFASVCERCAECLHTMFYDVYYGHVQHLPTPMKEMSFENFKEAFLRTEIKHLSFDECLKLERRK